MSSPTQLQRYWVLASYGWYALLLGAVDYVRGGFMVFATDYPAEVDFAGHLLQSHSCSLLGLGCVALCLRKAAGDLRLVYVALLVANALGACVEIPAALRGFGSLPIACSQVFWSACFLWLCLRTNADGQSSTPTLPMHSPRLMDRLTAFSFAAFVMLTGLCWVFVAQKFATAAAGPLAGPAAVFAGNSRGPADFALGAVALLVGARRELAQVRCLALSLFASNFVLLSAGIFAQLSVLSRPGRWVVFALHLLWTLGFAYVWYRLPPAAAPRSAPG